MDELLAIVESSKRATDTVNNQVFFAFATPPPPRKKESSVERMFLAQTVEARDEGSDICVP